jgi:XTP/dITP diphosphohydrolase
MVKVYLLTGNPHKVKEARAILADMGIEVEQLPGEKVEIQADSLEEIARYAARAAARVYKVRPIILEDSGLFVNALRGFPGPYSKYVYKTIGLEGLLRLMDGVEDRRAYFECAAACVCSDDVVEVEVGRVYGRIAERVRGNKGFGFDPIFVPEGYDKTFAELGEDVKNEISHRARALRAIARRVLARA